MKVLLVLLQRCLLFPLSFLLPRTPGTWVFGAPQDGFSGNPKYLFLWMSHFRPDVTCTWLTGSPATRALLRGRGYRCELRWSPAGVRAAASAQFHVVANDGSDTNFAFTGGARVLNLWHGVGIKNILRGARVGANAQLYAARWRPDVYLRSLHRFRRPDLVLATSPDMAAHFARCFDVPLERCPVLGYPRLDPYVDASFRELCLSFGDYDALRERCAGRTTYLYTPTLRDDDADLFSEAVPDVAALSAALAATDAVLLLKLHPFSAASVAGAVADYDNIVVWPEDLDLYPVLADVDCLITDYSSLLYDYIAFADSGVVVYAFDFERYVAQDRDLAFPFEENVVGVRADSFAELCAVLADGRALAPLETERLARIRTRFWGSAQPPSRPASAAIAAYAAGEPASLLRSGVPGHGDGLPPSGAGRHGA
ncbi:MAG: CDP-glycerol:poly(glycerophosphate) glycerophosphotransferase [uncultured Frankineae bacterium]|uniref:CDP-glycerol:poly(Glycerophosphate) glycerophosphotransferase n=1 Tax=uncultured Frankineae bacterium TaxID=437475 RepID=A0A6J4KQW7_9ACTN|nr:MAG: CDP-glycerol:poly(glycerophosphate) glycerophosphotransferase [uncultured Frankineae bacterium]